MSSDPRQLARQVFEDKIEQARHQHPFDKAMAGAALFDMLRERMAWGVQMEFPDADEKTIQRIVLERIAAQRAKGDVL
ncbi:MAG: hypothetical protein IT440_12075 [Phycisphaeraceae bacterium]|nr:hypothetical protein [Phycisphaeraceae bacterium]